MANESKHVIISCLYEKIAILTSMLGTARDLNTRD